MNVRCIAPLFLLLFSMASTCPAQVTTEQLSKKLVGRPYYLRGCWRDDELHFDRAGKLLSRSDRTSFTLSGIDVQSVRVEGGLLVIEGERVGLKFIHDKPVRVVLKRENWFHQVVIENVRIVIDLPAGGDPSEAVGQIFAFGLAEMAPNLPEEWRQFARTKILFLPAEPQPDDRLPTANSGGAIQPPKLITLGPGVVTDVAALFHYDADTLVNFDLDETGRPARLSIAGPAGLGLDEVALAIVRKSTFVPAMESGRPIKVKSTMPIHADTR